MWFVRINSFARTGNENRFISLFFSFFFPSLNTSPKGKENVAKRRALQIQIAQQLTQDAVGSNVRGGERGAALNKVGVARAARPDIKVKAPTKK